MKFKPPTVFPQDAGREGVEKACPFCGTWQIQVCMDYNNPEKDLAKCRHCNAQAPVKIWNKRVEK